MNPFLVSPDDDVLSSHEECENGNESPHRKHRSLIFHLLYAAESFDYDISLAAIIDNFNRGFELDIDPEGDIAQTVQAVINDRSSLDEAIKLLLAHWRLERVGVCTRLILRMAMWELTNTDTPHNIVINEAIELAKCFAEKDAYKFVNGVLDEGVKRMKK